MGLYDGIRWVERHEAFKDMTYCRFVDDDFTARTLDVTNTWRTQIAAAGSAAIIDAGACGILRMVTGILATNNVILDQNDIRTVLGSSRPVLSVKAKMLSVANDNIELYIGLVNVFGTDHCIFKVNRSVIGNLSIYANAYSGGVQKRNVDTTIDLDAATHVYELYIDANGKPYFYIDGVLVATGANADINPVLYFQPYVAIATQGIAAQTLDVDAVKGWMKRI